MEVAAESSRYPDLIRCSLQEAEEQMKIVIRKNQEMLKKIADKEDEIALQRSTLNVLKSRNESLRYNAAQRKEVVDHLHLCLDKLSFANNAYQDNAIKHWFDKEEEIDYRRMNFKIKHGKKSLQKERRVLREIEPKEEAAAGPDSSLQDIQSKITRFRYMLRCNFNMVTAKNGSGEELLQKQLKQHEMEKETIIANCVVGGKTWRSLGSRNAIKEHIYAKNKEAEESREEHWRVQVGIKRAKERLKHLQEGDNSLRNQLGHIRGRKQQVYKHILDLEDAAKRINCIVVVGGRE